MSKFKDKDVNANTPGTKINAALMEKANWRDDKTLSWLGAC